jgi:AcrR family transcriptional regulator
MVTELLDQDVPARAGRPRDPRLDDAIVAATLALLEERGYAGLSFTAVATHAGTTKPAIYRRWSSKRDLVLEAVFRTQGDDVVANTGDLDADMRTMVRWSLEKLGSPVGRAALAGLLAEPPGTAGTPTDQLTLVWRRMDERFREAIERGEANGWHTLVYGLTLALYSLPLRQGLLGFGFQTTRGFIHSAARPLRLSENDCRALVVELCAPLPQAVETLLSLRTAA